MTEFNGNNFLKY